jgi:hypothetical protein
MRIRRLTAVLGMLSHRPRRRQRGVEPVIVAPRGLQPAAACEHEATGMHMTCMPAGASSQTKPPPSSLPGSSHESSRSHLRCRQCSHQGELLRVQQKGHQVSLLRQLTAGQQGSRAAGQQGSSRHTSCLLQKVQCIGRQCRLLFRPSHRNGPEYKPLCPCRPPVVHLAAAACSLQSQSSRDLCRLHRGGKGGLVRRPSGCFVLPLSASADPARRVGLGSGLCRRRNLVLGHVARPGSSVKPGRLSGHIPGRGRI